MISPEVGGGQQIATDETKSGPLHLHQQHWRCTAIGVLEDPVFDPEQHAFHCVRALEIPTPSWTTRDAVFDGLGLPEGVPVAQYVHAYASPIWHLA